MTPPPQPGVPRRPLIGPAHLLVPLCESLSAEEDLRRRTLEEENPGGEPWRRSSM